MRSAWLRHRSVAHSATGLRVLVIRTLRRWRRLANHFHIARRRQSRGTQGCLTPSVVKMIADAGVHMEPPTLEERQGRRLRCGGKERDQEGVSSHGRNG